MMGSRSQNISSTSGSEAGVSVPSTRNIPYKTPARSLKHARASHNENTICDKRGAAGLTKKKQGNTVVFGTPAVGEPLKTLKMEKIPRMTSKWPALSEITNKTPFSKSQFPVTPVPASVKTLRSFAISNKASGAPAARRISSTRKKLRLPKSANKRFETPETRGNHWDVSDMSVDVSAIEDAGEAVGDYDDVEYGPPTATCPRYEPSFEMPDYRQIGGILMSLFRQQTICEEYESEHEFDGIEQLAKLDDLRWEEILEQPQIPLENIFPFMVRSEFTTGIPLRVHKDRHSRKGKPKRAYNNANEPSKLKSSVPTHPTASARKPSSILLPRNPILNPLGMATAAHSRVSESHAPAAVVPHSSVTFSRSKPILSRHAGMPKPLSSRMETQNASLYASEVFRDALGSLLAATGQDLPCEDFLFDV